MSSSLAFSTLPVSLNECRNHIGDARDRNYIDDLSGLRSMFSLVEQSALLQVSSGTSVVESGTELSCCVRPSPFGPDPAPRTGPSHRRSFAPSHRNGTCLRCSGEVASNPSKTRGAYNLVADLVLGLGSDLPGNAVLYTLLTEQDLALTASPALADGREKASVLLA